MLKYISKNKLILSFIVPIIYLIMELSFLYAATESLIIKKPIFLIVVLFLIFFSGLIFYPNVKIIFDFAVFSISSIMMFINTLFIKYSGYSGLNFHSLSITYFTPEYLKQSSMYYLLIIKYSAITSVLVLDILLGRDKYYVLNISKLKRKLRIQSYYILFFILNIFIIPNLFVKIPPVKYDIEKFTNNSYTLNSFGLTNYCLNILFNNTEHELNIINPNNEQIHAFYPEAENHPLELDEKNPFFIENRSFLVINIPGLYSEIFNYENKIYTDNDIRTLLPALYYLQSRGDYYDKFINKNPAFISESVSVLGQVPSHGSINFSRKEELVYSLPNMLSKINYETMYITTNYKNSFNRNDFFKNTIGFKKVISQEIFKDLNYDIKTHIGNRNDFKCDKLIEEYLLKNFINNNNERFLLTFTLNSIPNFIMKDVQKNLRDEEILNIINSPLYYMLYEDKELLNYFLGLKEIDMLLTNVLFDITDSSMEIKETFKNTEIFLLGNSFDFNYRIKNLDVYNESFGHMPCLIRFPKTGKSELELKNPKTIFDIAPTIIKEQSLDFPSKIYLSRGLDYLYDPIEKYRKYKSKFFFSSYFKIYSYIYKENDEDENENLITFKNYNELDDKVINSLKKDLIQDKDGNQILNFFYNQSLIDKYLSMPIID